MSQALSARGPPPARGPVNFRTPPVSARGAAPGSSSASRASGRPAALQQLDGSVPRGAGRAPGELSAREPLTRRLADAKPQIVEFLNLSNYTNQVDSVVPVDEPLFRPSPGVIEFARFESLQTFDATLSFRNQDNVARRVRVTQPDSRFFQVLPGRGRKLTAGGDKVAPGMEVSYIVRFTPDSQEHDYSYDLEVATEREKFIVPIRASGGSAMLEVPESVSFGMNPVSYESTKTVLIRNIGEKPARFAVQTSPPFRVSARNGYLEVNALTQVEVFFKPDRALSYEGELLLKYGSNLSTSVRLSGIAHNVQIEFSKNKLGMSDTFIALSTQSTMVIHNRSEVPVDYSWRAFATMEEEIGQKLTLQTQLRGEEAEEVEAIKRMALVLEPGTPGSESEEDEGSETSSEEMDADREGRAMVKATETLQRRYRNIAKAIVEDPMYFYDEIFSVQPLSGKIWANSKLTVTITFTPKAALNYECIAFCAIVGQEERVPLLLTGQGIGPKAAFSFPELEVGDIFVESHHQYSVDLINQGDIAVSFELAPNLSPFGSKFSFAPSSGRLEVGGQCTITVEFVPDLLGEFHETFDWKLLGSASSLTLTFIGNSVSPTFNFDVDRISFGVVSYGFLNSKTVTLTNTSEVPMRFALRIPGDGRFAQREFDIIPSRGMLRPDCSLKVQIDFISVNVKTYDLCLVVDLDGVGQELRSIPIQARCAVPTVALEPADVLQFNNIFVRYPTQRPVVLKNTSALPAKFQVLPQDEQIRSFADIEPDQAIGAVPAASSHVITFTMTSKKIGQLQIPAAIRFLGDSRPQQIMLSANSIGPIVQVEPSVLDWGNAKCLEPITREVKVTNACVIAAHVRAFMKAKRSLWAISPKSFTLEPHASTSLTLTLTIDEAIKMTDVMHLSVHEGRDVAVTVKAQGVSTPVTCKEPLDVLDFGTQYTTQTIGREFLLENRGTKQRKLVWVHDVDIGKSAKHIAEAKPKVFSVLPETVLLDGKCGYRFQFDGMSTKPGLTSETLCCQEYVGNDRKGRTILKCELRGNFVAPLLEFSAKTISFRFLWSNDEPLEPLAQRLSLRNVSPLHVNFSIRAQPPFHVNVDAVALAPEELTEVQVEFDPGFKADRACSTVKQKMSIIYQDHPQKDFVNLIGEVVFPNILLSSEKLDFGSVLNNTTKQLCITMSNPQELPVRYQWMFLEEEEPAVAPKPSPTTISRLRSTNGADVNSKFQSTTSSWIEAGSIDELGLHRMPTSSTIFDTARGESAGRTGTDINQIFDILPIMGELQPGASQTITFTYYGHTNQKFDAVAACQVEGGPEYEVTLTGQASGLEFKIDKTDLDFGDVPFNQVLERELILQNSGKVSFYYTFNLTNMKRPNVVDASPMLGLIHPEHQQKITMRFRTGIPDLVCETVLLEVAHFEPVKIHLRGKGLFPGVLLKTSGPDGSLRHLQRTDEEEHQRRRNAACAQLLGPTQRPASQGKGAPTAPAITRAVSMRGVGGGGGGAALVAPTLTRAVSVDGGAGGYPTLTSGQFAALAFPLLQPLASIAETPGPYPRSKASSVPDIPALAGTPDIAMFASDDVEAEADRRFLCDVLLAKEREAAQVKQDTIRSTMRSFGRSTKNGGLRPHMKELPAITTAYYTCDFGHLVLGHSGRKAIFIQNCYNEPISFTINRRQLSSQGFTVMPEKVKRLPSGKYTRFELTCFRSRDAAEGKQELDWVIPIKNGPFYEVKLVSNFVLPDLELSMEHVDFGRVVVGQVKRIIIQLTNVKAVPVEWEYKAPKKLGKPLPPSETIYSLSPSSGKMQPQETQRITVSFTPTAAKIFNAKLPLRISDNPNRKILSLRGQGDSLRVEVIPSSTFELGPILPGNDNCTQEFFLYNPTDYPIEVYSVDFDQQYRNEEEMLRVYDKYDEHGLVELPVRQPGEGTWAAVEQNAMRLRRVEERRQRRKELRRLRKEALERGEEPEQILEDDENSDAEVAHIESATDLAQASEMDIAEYPLRVPPEERLNVLLLGPPMVGKSSTAASLSAKDGRCVLRLDAVVDWALAGPPSLRSKDDEELRLSLLELMRKSEEEHEHREAEREKLCKKSRELFVKHALEHYSLPVPDVAKLIRQRTQLPDCNCGVIFDGLDSKYMASAEAAAEVILSATSEKCMVLYAGLQDHLGFQSQDPVTLGISAAPLARLAEEVREEQGGERSEGLGKELEQLATSLHSYLLDTQHFLKSEMEELQQQLHAAEEKFVAMGGELPPPPEAAPSPSPTSRHRASPTRNRATPSRSSPHMGARASPHPAHSRGSPTVEAKISEGAVASAAETVEGKEGGPAEVLQDADAHAMEEAEAQAARDAAHDWVQQLKAKVKDCAAAITRLDSSLLGKEAALAEDVRETLVTINRVAARLLEGARPQPIPATLDGAEKEVAGAAAATPPTASPVAVTPGEDAASVAGPLRASKEAPGYAGTMTLVPLAVEANGDGQRLQHLASAAANAVPEPLIPLLPPPTFAQIVRKPPPRKAQPTPEKFLLITPQEGEEAAESGKEEAGKKPEVALDRKVTQSINKLPLLEEVPEDEEPEPPQSRWLLAPRGKARLLLKFASEEIGNFASALTFEVVGGSSGNTHVSVTATGTTAYPSINSDPRNVFMRRVKAKPASGYAKKQYIASLSVFDFGPLLAGRDPASASPPPLPPPPPAAAAEGGASGQPAPPPQLDANVRQHVEALRITNNSLFRAKVHFQLASAMQDAHDRQPPVSPTGHEKHHGKGRRSVSTDRVKLAGNAAAALFESYPFIIEPATLELDIDETKEVKVSCFPVREGSFSDCIVARVEDNPEAAQFPICAIGAMPKVNLDMSEVDFDRMLLRQKATEKVKLANVCAVPVLWKLVLPDAGIPEPFAVEPTEGTLLVGEELEIAVTFRADEPAMHKFKLKLQVGDTEDLKPLEDTQEIEVRAEAFEVDVVPEFPNGERGLDLGDIRVGLSVEQQFQVSNNGKYPVKYEVRVRRKVIREILDIEMPLNDEGVAILEPGQKKKVTIRCSPTAEMQCPDPQKGSKNDELQLVVFEAKTGERLKLDIPPISLSFRALYNSFSVSPPRGLNFGPVRIGEIGTREFEIYNDGTFKLDWCLFDLQEGFEHRKKLGGSEAPPPDKKQQAAAQANPGLAVGPFRIKPGEGSLKPKESIKVEVKFNATEDKHYDCKVGMHVDGMAPALLAGGNKELGTEAGFFPSSPGTAGGGASREVSFREYLLNGQSCTPGIDVESIQTIFEEQFVARTLEDAVATAGRVDIRAFCEEDRVFSFGPVVVQGQQAEAANQESAKFRITNPKAIPCDVRFEIKPRTVTKDVPAFDLSAAELHIPPHEYRYVKVRFRPTSLQTYSALFKADVLDGRDPQTNSLQFELRGDGTLPTITLDGSPSSSIFGDAGGEFHFGKFQVGQAHPVVWVLRNNGVIPATARCDYPTSPHFTVACPKTVTLEPKAQHPFQVQFHPREVGDFTVPLRLFTIHNPFEDTTVKIAGAAYKDDVAWDLQGAQPQAPVVAEAAGNGLPQAADTLNLGAVPIGKQVALTFHINNTSVDPIRFQFPETLPAPFSKCLKISPSVGHVQPGSAKAISCHFTPSEKLSAEVLLQPTVASIRYEGPAEDWDDSMRTVDFSRELDMDDVVSEGSPNRGKKAAAAVSSPRKSKLKASRQLSPPPTPRDAPDAEQVKEVVAPEPQHKMVPGTQRALTLKLSAVADEQKYECTTQNIRFGPTVLFQTRMHRFNVGNPSTIPSPFEWHFLPPDGLQRDRGLQAYSIEPKVGKIAPGGTKEFVVRFSPTECDNFVCRLRNEVPCYGKESRALQLRVEATALRPWCHFELPPSDYRSRRQSDTPLDAKYSIVEVESLGTRIKNTRRFYVLNPTSETYDFIWKPEEVEGGVSGRDDPFRCITKRGTILAGKKYEMIFEYLPAATETYESAWTFSLLTKDVKQHFLLVGSVKEARIGMDKPSINFGRLLLGGKRQETVNIVNKEHMPFSFSLSTAGLAEGQAPVLSISRMSGVVGPNTVLPISLSFEPQEEKPYNFNIICTVKRKEKPILLNVKGEGYKIRTKLLLEGKEEQAERQLHPGVREVLDFGVLQVQERRTFTLRLSSPGFQRDRAKELEQDAEETPMVKYDFCWQMRTASAGVIQPGGSSAPYFTISPMNGVATQDKETTITLEYCPLEPHSLEGSTLRMLIPSGPGDASYHIQLLGRANRADLDFSFYSHDFGPCFVKRGGSLNAAEPVSPTSRSTPAEQKDLVVTNRGESDCWLTTTFVRSSWLDVQLGACMIEAGQSIVVPVIFTPRDYVGYQERVEFVINDCTQSYVNVRGRGCELNLEVTSMAMQNVDFGVTVGNQLVTRTVKVVNRAPREVEFELHDPDSQLAERCVSWAPTTSVALRPKEQLPIELRFEPSYHVAPFKLPLQAKSSLGQVVHLLNVAGTCHTAEVRLSEHSILFGDVVIESKGVRKLKLHNFGDLGVKFRFEMNAKVANFFAIEPSEGFAAPHTDVPLQVTFRPTRQSLTGTSVGERDTMKPKKIRCVLEPNLQQDPVEVIVQGRPVEQPSSAARLLEFSCEVREKKTLEVKFPPDGKNPTSEPWKLSPVVNTEIPSGVSYWHCPAEVVVPPNGQASVEISYRPLTMTARKEGKASAAPPASAEEISTSPPGKKGNDRRGSAGNKRPPDPAPERHVGMIFVPTPDGSAFIFNLEGVAVPATHAKKISAEVQCKKPFVQHVPISNWLQESQRFSVAISLLEPVSAGEEIRISGVETFDLPPGMSKDYRFNVYAYREGAALARLVFTNPRTEEFVVYEASFKFVAPDSLDTIKFSTTCRELASHSITVMNPLSVVAAFKCEASVPDIRFSSPEFSVMPSAEASVDVLFRSLVPGKGDGTLLLKSEQLGSYPYTLQYDVKSAGLEKTIVFKAPLGSTNTVQSFKFVHHARRPTVYAASIEAAPGHKGPRNDFVLESKSVQAPAAGEEGAEAAVEVRFQPSSLSEVRALLALKSPEGGEYKALLVGYSQPPQPQGPVVITSGRPGVVEFHNPFEETVEFSVQVDNPIFLLGSRMFKLDAKKTSPITVQFKADTSHSGRLIITAQKFSTSWTFFLKGTTA